jgi:hypothetical protein
VKESKETMTGLNNREQKQNGHGEIPAIPSTCRPKSSETLWTTDLEDTRQVNLENVTTQFRGGGPQLEEPKPRTADSLSGILPPVTFRNPTATISNALSHP